MDLTDEKPTKTNQKKLHTIDIQMEGLNQLLLLLSNLAYVFGEINLIKLKTKKSETTEGGTYHVVV